jgi:hypothetical protein
VSSEQPIGVSSPPGSALPAAEVEAILRERRWLDIDATPELSAWLQHAALLLGLHAMDRAALADVLELIFDYDADALLAIPENQAVLARVGAREVIRELAHRILDGPGLDSDRYKEIIDGIKATLRYRGRELFFPIRLALAGRAGEGKLDRVILLLDSAAKLPFTTPVKDTRQRMLEFCSALD